jgi:hypothetical protein
LTSMPTAIHSECFSVKRVYIYHETLAIHSQQFNLFIKLWEASITVLLVQIPR